MTDLRQAAQAVIDRWDSPLWKNGSTADAIADLRTALKQQAEPVAWQWLDTANFRKKIPANATPTHWRPLYTFPPQHKKLSAGEILNMVPSAIPAEYDGELMEFARAVVAKLKEGA